MNLIAITPEHTVVGEATLITRLIERGFYRVHLRKPSYDISQLRELIESVPSEFYPYLSLHDHHLLAMEYGLGGVHINSRNPLAPPSFNGLVSCSCHSLDEISSRNCDYYFLSPVFDSISKQDYRSAFTLTELSNALKGDLSQQRIYALGGVNVSRLNLIKELGFAGAAMLGAVWQGNCFSEIAENIDQICYNFNS